MANMPLTDIGITPRKASQFSSKGIETVTDLLGYYPTKYLDFRNPISFAEGKYHQGEHVAIKGKVVSGRVIDGKHYMLRLTDGNTFCTVFWFNQPFRTRQFSVGDVIALGGVVSWNEQYNNMTMATPDFVTTDIASAFSIQPVYRKIKGMSVEYLEDAIKLAMPYTRECSTETLSLAQMRALRVPPIAEAIHMAHQPTDEKEIRLSRKRRAVDVLYPFCYELEAKKAEAAKVSFCRIKSTRDVLNKMQGVLPFKLTEDQSPLIEDSDSETLEGVDSVETTYKKLTEWFKPYPGVTIKAISGDMKAKEVQEGIEAFAQNQANILISTTIVEVGVNVPNATVIVIKNAERFGLAQLHQLRGRVGRSSLQSYCVLLSKDKENERLKTMEATNDGFKIAEKDLELRGTGQILGVKQSGKDAVMEMALNYPQLYQAVRKQAEIQYKIDHPMG